MTNHSHSDELLKAILNGEPFHIIFDDQMRVLSYGRSLMSIAPDLTVGAFCGEIFEIKVPVGGSLECFYQSKAIQKATLYLRSSQLSLRGQFVFSTDGSGGAFVGSPWFNRIEEFDRHKVGLEMLPAHYGIIECLFILQTNNATIRDFKRLVAELNVKRVQLSDAREEALHAAESKARFLAMMSHEIRTPMNGILGMAHLLTQTPLNSEQREYLTTIRECAGGLLQILNDVLDISKLNAGKFQIARSPFHIFRTAQSIEKLFRPLIEDKGVSFHLECDLPEGLLVVSDENRIRQVLVNLLGNAMKFTDQGSITLRMRSKPHSPQIEIEVSDTGIGMSSETIETLFQPFAQGRSELERGRGGTGLGLTICKKLAELMGGGITAESSLSGGTTFRVTIEAPQAPVERPSEHSSAVTESQAPFSIPDDVKILLVEDNNVNALLVKRLLAKWGGSVAHAKNGREAVDLAEETYFDIILMDCQMPVMDGFEATRMIRAGEGRSKTSPIIALTANAFSDSEKMCFDAGMDDFIAKPIDLQRFVGCLRRRLSVVDGT